jgi:beta-glucosidase
MVIVGPESQIIQAGYIVEPGEFQVGIGNGLTSQDFSLTVTPRSP